MLPSINIGIMELPLYGPMFLIGFIIAIVIAVKLGHKYGMKKDDILTAAVYGAIGLFIGAKAFYFFTKIPSIIKHWDDFISNMKVDFTGGLDYMFGGMVFYGGLIGFCLGVLRYCVHFKVNIWDITDLYAPLLPLAHGFGRIGCFLAGCCYGMEYHGPLAVHFPDNGFNYELSSVPRFPVQLLEAFLNFICFGVLLTVLIKSANRPKGSRKLKQGRLLGIYLTYYLIARTFLEMLRGDSIRGSVGFLSTSQLIGILLIPAAVFFIMAKGRKEIFSGLETIENGNSEVKTVNK